MMVKLRVDNVCQFSSCRESAAVPDGCRDGTGIHEAYRRHLIFLRLRALTVRIVSRYMTDRKLIIRRCIGHTEARAADTRAKRHASIRKIHRDALVHKILHNRK